ncbi:hypothetical protein GGS21DRAFT_489560 [Xylaria nigripes]|nr:hypothetical protein GGS21DRAFT_489560 [Xylaria nigripes]
MAGLTSDEDDLAYGERWDHDRLAYERDRFEERDRLFTHVLPQHLREPSRDRVREDAVDERYVERRAPRPWEDHHFRERRYYEESPQRRASPSPEMERRIYLESKQDREYHNSSPLRRSTTLLRPDSPLDIPDRPPPQRIYERDEYVPLARRREHRLDPYESIPLPRSRALPPPRIYAENDYEEIRIAESTRHGDEDFRAYPDQFRDKEIVRIDKRRERSVSQSSRARRYHSHSRRSSSRSSPTMSSSASETGGTTITAKSEYPKKGKTRIPIRLVSIRAIAELQHPYVMEGNTVIIQKALGQKNIDDLLKLSEDYKKADAELAAARSIPGPVLEERREEVFTIPPPAPPALVRAPAPPPIELVKEPIVNEAPPNYSYTSYNTTSAASTSCGFVAPRPPVIIEPRTLEVSENVAAGPVALVGDWRTDHRHRYQHRSRSRGRELVRTERLPTGELVVYEEEIERVEEPRRGVRIEKDKKGRMSISVPKYRK